MQTRGNTHAHLVLRGGLKPNYDADSIALCEWMMQRAGLRPVIVVDCSHGNSQKDSSRQALVFRDCIRQRKEGTASIVGLMLESNIRGGRQDIPKPPEAPAYGISVTDACLEWEKTEALILEAHQMLCNN